MNIRVGSIFNTLYLSYLPIILSTRFHRCGHACCSVSIVPRKRGASPPTFIPIVAVVPLKATVYGSRDKRKNNYQLAPRCRRDRKRQVEPEWAHRDKPLHVGITVLRGTRTRVASGDQVAPAAATTRPSSRSQADP